MGSEGERNAAQEVWVCRMEKDGGKLKRMLIFLCAVF
jgi:hypothetical protein